MVGDLGNNPRKIRKKNFDGENRPWSWKESDGVIGQEMIDPSTEKSLKGWRDDMPGHVFENGKSLDSHINVWFDGVELHLLY